jgi:hypothetical protein
MPKSVERQYQDEIDEMRRMLKAYERVLTADIDNYTVQSCCICYGGNSFPGPMLDALKCHLQIIQSRVDEILAPTADIG